MSGTTSKAQFMHQNLKACILDLKAAQTMHDLGGQVFYTTSEGHGRLPLCHKPQKNNAGLTKARAIYEDPTAVFFFVY